VPSFTEFPATHFGGSCSLGSSPSFKAGKYRDVGVGNRNCQSAPYVANCGVKLGSANRAAHALGPSQPVSIGWLDDGVWQLNPTMRFDIDEDDKFRFFAGGRLPRLPKMASECRWSPQTVSEKINMVGLNSTADQRGDHLVRGKEIGREFILRSASFSGHAALNLLSAFVVPAHKSAVVHATKPKPLADIEYFNRKQRTSIFRLPLVQQAARSGGQYSEKTLTSHLSTCNRRALLGLLARWPQPKSCHRIN
jgi:hypothetical protein